MSSLDLADLLESWQTHLETERKSANTVRLYVAGVRGFLAWCDLEGRPRPWSGPPWMPTSPGC